MATVQYGPYKLPEQLVTHIESMLHEYQPKVPLTIDDIKITLPYTEGVYRIGDVSVRYPVHFGQMKLFVSEVQAIEYAKSTKLNIHTMVYAGAAPGTHVLVLSEMYPEIQFVLYDPASFDHRLYGKPNVGCIQDLFTDADVVKWTGADILFVSDIRSGTVDNDTTFNKFVEEDMLRQQDWVIRMRPPLALMKFRLDYTDGKVDKITNYLDGVINLQSFCANTSTEGRIMIDRRQFCVGEYIKRDYSAMEYEQKQAYFNTIIREWGTFHNSDAGSLGLCVCFNCSHFAHIMRSTSTPVLTVLNRLIETTKQRLDCKSHGWLARPWTGPVGDRERLYANAGAITERLERKVQSRKAREMPVSRGIDHYKKHHK